MNDLPGRRIGIKFPNGETLYYDIDADDRVYWLRPVGMGRNKLERRRVRDNTLAEWIRGKASTTTGEQ